MTLEQLMSPKVSEWLDTYNKKLNEGVEYSDDTFFKEFDEWFVQNENEINESIDIKAINEAGAFDDLFDEDELEAEEETPSEEETEEDDEKEEETISKDPRSKVKVDNGKNRRRNVFNVVNLLYDKILKEGKNMDKLTYLKMLDTSDVHDMTALLAFTNLPNADLSSWDTSYVSNMEGMFYKSTFNNDSICDWNVENCAKFKNMFLGSKFNQSLSKWKPKMIKSREVTYDDETGERKVEEITKRAPLPFVGAYEDEEREMDAAFWDEKFKDGIEESVKHTPLKKSKYSHVMDFETFMMNEGLLDKAKSFVKKGVDKVKSLFKLAAIRVNEWLVSFIGEGGEPIPAVNPYTTINYISSGSVAGVTAAFPAKNELLNDNVPTHINRIEESGYYGTSWKDNEKSNYKYFLGELKKIQENLKANPFDAINEEVDNINEARVGFSAESGGLKGIADIGSAELKNLIRRRMLSTPGTKGKDALGALLIWGAPGVGKSTIPNAIIDEYNENAKTEGKALKALIVAECGDMTVDGFALPMPVHTSMADYIKDRPEASKLAKELGLSEDALENSTVTRSDDAPKMWLPCYKPVSDPKINQLRKMIANGHIREYYDENGEYHVDETCDGGLIMFDEFFRADPSIFKILMQILLNRSYAGFTIGDKWGIIACSNRPNDDDEVSDRFENTGAVVTTRVTQFNFVPDFKDWQKWAVSKGHFDEDTISFLVDEKDGNGEYVNWHNIDPQKHAEGETAHPTPRSWAHFMKELWNIMDIDGYKSISEIPPREIETHGYATIGEETTKKYIDWINGKSKTALKMSEVFSNSSYIIPEPIPSAAEMSEKVYNYVETNYAPDSLPPVEELVNMYELLNKTYSKTKDNYIKEMHINIVKYLMQTPEAKKEMLPYFKLVKTRYDIKPEDLNN